MSEKYEIRLISLVDLDQEAKLVTVQIKEMKPGYFRGKTVTYDATFTYLSGEWVGADNLIVSETELKYRLQECLVANEANSRVEQYVSTL
jgi:hypothetical protein